MNVKITWSLVRAGRCPTCRDYKLIWTNSHANRLSSTDDGSELSSCADCWRRRARYFFNYTSQSREYDYRTLSIFINGIWELIQNTLPIGINEEDYPYLLGLKKCEVCEIRMENDDSIVAVRADDPNTEMLVHKFECSSYARCCGRTFISGGINLNDMRFLVTRNVENETICNLCLEERMTERGDNFEDDYFYCNYCDNYQHTDRQTYYDGEPYCETCVDNNLYRCDDCGETYWDGQDHYCDDSNYGGLIHDYSYKPRPCFYGRAPGERLFMGFELEVEIRQGGIREHAQSVVNELGDRAYLKYDGSLENGFEIVTHPHTLEAYRKEFAFSSFKKFRQAGLRSWNTNTCGLHVHVSRDAFGVYENRTGRVSNNSRQFHELRFIKLIYDNQRQVCALAGRNSEFANFVDKGKLHHKILRGYSEGGRYSAVNTENENTLEVRLFRGSLNENRVFMALEFVHSAVEYTRNLKVNGKNKALSWVAFAGYVHANQEKYPNLLASMSSTLERGIPNDTMEE